jgi:predicted enzyme related to lactoylglutathione lyase
MPREGFPPGVPSWVDVTCPDPPAAAAFYAGVFGWELEDAIPPSVPAHYFIARLDGHDVAAVGSQVAGGDPPWNTYVGVENADADAGRVDGAGGRVLVDPFDVMAAGRMVMCADPARSPLTPRSWAGRWSLRRRTWAWSGWQSCAILKAPSSPSASSPASGRYSPAWAGGR